MTPRTCDLAHRGRDLLPLGDAVARLLALAKPLATPPESLPLEDAVGRVLADPVVADRSEPPLPRSAMDGFAVRAADGDAPREILGAVFAGDAQTPSVGEGQAVAVMTGGTVAPGADTVVPVEQTRVEGSTLHLEAAPSLGRHVRRAGEICAADELLLPAGTLLGAGDAVVLAGCGADPVPVRPRPTVAILATGDEVVPWTSMPEPHQVRDSNRLGLGLQVARSGGQVVSSEHRPDVDHALREQVGLGLERADLLITLGGVSMGDRDLMPDLFEDLGVEQLFHGVAIQPGKPVWVGFREDRWVLGLPGNPVSAFVVFELIGVPLLRRLLGIEPAVRPVHPATAGGEAGAHGRERWFPSRLAADGQVLRATPVVSTGSGDWTGLAGCDALLRVPAHSSVGAGECVDVLPLG